MPCPDVARESHASAGISGTGGRGNPTSPEGRFLWTPELDRLLRANKLPTWDTAPIEALASKLQPDARRVLARYLAGSSEKAFSIVISVGWSFRYLRPGETSNSK